MYSFSMIVLDGAGEFSLRPRPCSSCSRNVKGKQNARRRVDRHRGRDRVERRWPTETASMSSMESIATPTLPTSPSAKRRIRVVADLRRQIERGPTGPSSHSPAEICSACWTPRHRPCWHTGASSTRRPRYIVGWMPRVKGYSPAHPASPPHQIHQARSIIKTLDRDSRCCFDFNVCHVK